MKYPEISNWITLLIVSKVIILVTTSCKNVLQRRKRYITNYFKIELIFLQTLKLPTAIALLEKKVEAIALDNFVTTLL